MKIFASSMSDTLASQIATIGNYTLGQVVHNLFADREMCPQLLGIQSKDTIALVQATPPPAGHLLKLLLMLNAAQQVGASKVIAVVPYLGYARQDRVYEQGQPYSIQLIARLIAVAGAHLCITCGVHTQDLNQVFNIPVQNISTAPLFIPYLAQLRLANPLFVAPDTGAIPLAKKYAKHFGTTMIALTKHRTKPNQIADLKFQNADYDVMGADVVLVDDMIDTGQTLCRAATLLYKKGVRSIRVVCTHALLSGNAFTCLSQANIVEIITTNTLIHTAPAPNFTILSIAPLLAHALGKIS